MARLWLYAFFLGAELGAVYDILSMLRVFFGASFSPLTENFLQAHSHPLLRVKKRGCRNPLFLKIFLFWEDLLFCLFSVASIILLFYQFNNGKIRIPVLFCLLIGFLCYRMTLGRLLRPVFEIIALILKNILYYILYFVSLPFKKAIISIKKTVISIYQNHIRKRERKQRVRFTNAEKHRLDQDACGLL